MTAKHGSKLAARRTAASSKKAGKSRKTPAGPHKAKKPGAKTESKSRVGKTRPMREAGPHPRVQSGKPSTAAPKPAKRGRAAAPRASARRGAAVRAKKATRVLVVIPAHNEEETIREVVVRSLKYADVSVTDDGSRDRTLGILEDIRKEAQKGKHPHRLNIVRHPRATHIPRAVQDGLKWGVAQGKYDYFITMDSGMSHNPDELPDFIRADPEADVVIGSRKKPENVPVYRRLVSRLGAMVINYALSKSYWDFAGPRLMDCTSGFRRYSRRAAEVVAAAELKSRAFDFHMEALALCLRRSMRPAEIPISYVFSNSSFNRKVLWQAMKFGFFLIKTK